MCRRAGRARLGGWGAGGAGGAGALGPVQAGRAAAVEELSPQNPCSRTSPCSGAALASLMWFLSNCIIWTRATGRLHPQLSTEHNPPSTSQRPRQPPIPPPTPPTRSLARKGNTWQTLTDQNEITDFLQDRSRFASISRAQIQLAGSDESWLLLSFFPLPFFFSLFLSRSLSVSQSFFPRFPKKPGIRSIL